MKIEKTNRVIDFTDRYGRECSLQESSLATEYAIWFGCNEANPQELIPDKGWVPIDMPEGYHSNTRMHLTQEQVKELLPYLFSFVETGKLDSWPAGRVFDVKE